MEIAELKFDIDYSSAEGATKALNDLADAADNAREALGFLLTPGDNRDPRIEVKDSWDKDITVTIDDDGWISDMIEDVLAQFSSQSDVSITVVRK